MQIVFISKRVDMLRDTLLQVKTFMPFVHEAIVIGPSFIKNSVLRVSHLRCKYLDEDELLDLSSKKIKDHSHRNFLLRMAMLKSDLLDSEFIMSDDDYRPIVPIDESTFMKNGKYRNYFFYDLNKWSSHRNSFDRGQYNSLLILERLGCTELAYASHLPQIINKALFKNCIDLIDENERDQPLCEWAIYFNIARMIAPERFSSPEPYMSLCWPDYPVIWDRYIDPLEFKFENYYPFLYNKNDLFWQVNPLPNHENYKEVLETKLKRISDLEESGDLPRMSYRGFLFQLFYPVLNLIYKYVYIGYYKRSRSVKSIVQPST